MKFNLKIVLNNHRAWPSQSTLPCNPEGITLAQIFRLLTACTLLLVGVWICKNVQNQAVGTCMAFSVIFPFPIKPPASNTDFPLCVLGHMVPVKSCDWGVRQSRDQQLHWCWCLELGFSVRAFSDLKLCLVVGINRTFQMLAWYRVEWFCWGYTALCLLRTWAVVSFKKKKVNCCSHLCQSHQRFFYKQQQVPSSMFLAFQCWCSQVFLCSCPCSFSPIGMQYDTVVPFLAVAMSITLHSDSLPYLLFCSHLSLAAFCVLQCCCVTVDSMSLV